MASGVLEDLGYKATFCPHQDESERLWESRNCFLRCGCWDPGTRIYDLLKRCCILCDLPTYVDILFYVCLLQVFLKFAATACFLSRRLLIPLQVYQRSWLAETAHSRTPGQKTQGGFGKHSK